MHLLIRFKNRQLLYYYLLFLFILGSCTINRGTGETADDAEMEEIDDDEFKDESGMDKDAVSSDDNSDPDIILVEDELSDPDAVEIDILDFDSVPDDDADTFPDLSGSWVNLTVFRGKAKPFLISTCNAWAVMISKVVIEQNGDVLESTNEMCRLKVGNDTVPQIQSLVPDSYADSLPVVPKTFYLSKNDSGEILFHQPKVWEVRACNLADPENDALPTEEDDPRVFDPDNTGINGLKMQAKGTVNGFAEIVQKVSTILDGKLDGNGEIRGLTTWYEDQKVLWTDNVLMWKGAPTSNDPSIDPADSHFIFKKIDTDKDCDWIYQNSAVLFPEDAAKYPEQFQ